MPKGVGGHQRGYRGATDTWLTPPWLIKALGNFDLDPCCPTDMPWRTAAKMLTAKTDGLAADWAGRVWLNPPYGPETWKWVQRLAQHGNGIALIFARTETTGFQRYVFGMADEILFLRGRLHFHDVSGKRAPFNAGAPSCLVAYGEENTMALRRSGLGASLSIGSE